MMSISTQIYNSLRHFNSVNRKIFFIFILLNLLSILAALSQPLSIFVDEGQYLLIAKKMLDGWVPYRDIVENKPLGMYLSLIPAVLLCGRDFVKLRLFGAFVVSFTSFFIFLIGEKVRDWKAGLLGAVIFILLEAFPGFFGYNLLSEPMANLFIAAFFYLLISNSSKLSKWMLMGILAASACSIKQTAVFIFIPLAFVLIRSRRELRGRFILSFMLGIGVVLLPMLLYLFLNSALDEAVRWTFFSLLQLGGSSLQSKLETFFIFSFLFFPFILSSLMSLMNMSEMEKLIWVWLLSSIIFVQIGYAWFHNYLFVFPAVSLLAAMGLLNSGGVVVKKHIIMRGVSITVCLGMMVVFLCEVVMTAWVAEEGRLYKFHASWWEQEAVSSFIATHTEKGERIFVFRNDAEVYYLSERDPVGRMTFFFWDYFASMDENQMREFIFEPLEEHKPGYVVFNSADFSAFEKVDNSVAVKRYIDERYEYVMSSGPLEVYRRKA